MIVQNYNSVLTLSHLYQCSDAILVHENDTVHRICAQLMNIKHISFSDVNKVIAHQLGSVLQPAHTADTHSQYCRNPMGEHTYCVCVSEKSRNVHTRLPYTVDVGWGCVCGVGGVCVSGGGGTSQCYTLNTDSVLKLGFVCAWVITYVFMCANVSGCVCVLMDVCAHTCVCLSELMSSLVWHLEYKFCVKAWCYVWIGV